MERERESSEKPPQPPGGSANSGCLRLILAGPILVLGAPLVAAMRSLARWRRGRDIRVQDVRDEKFGRYRSLHSAVDYPSSCESCSQLTSALAVLASSLSHSSDNHYLLYRESEAGILLGLGPSIQDLAERFLIMCRKSSIEGRSLLWLSLDRSRYIGEYLEAEKFNPDAGDTDRLLGEAPLNWALKIRRKRSSVSTRYEIHLYLPAESGTYGEDFIRQLETT